MLAGHIGLLLDMGWYAAVVEQAGRGEEAEADRFAGGFVVEHAVGVGLDAEQQAEQRLG